MSMVASPGVPGESRGLQVFAFEGAAVRTLTINGEPWFVGKDACEVVGISKYRDALAQLDEDERVSAAVDTPGGTQQMVLVSEPGIYALMLISRSPRVKAFRRWITHEVIPSIRKTGSYSVAEVSRKDLALMVIQAEEEKEALVTRVRELEPAAHAWDVLASASGDYSLRDSAFILNRDPNIDTGQQRLMKLIRALNMVDRNGTPYARHASHLTERPQTYTHPRTGEEVLARPQIRITVQGLRYLHGKLGGEGPLQLPLDGAA
jgi:prophage antirepressor-like protein